MSDKPLSRRFAYTLFETILGGVGCLRPYSHVKKMIDEVASLEAQVAALKKENQVLCEFVDYESVARKCAEYFEHRQIKLPDALPIGIGLWFLTKRKSVFLFVAGVGAGIIIGAVWANMLVQRILGG